MVVEEGNSWLVGHIVATAANVPSSDLCRSFAEKGKIYVMTNIL